MKSKSPLIFLLLILAAISIIRCSDNTPTTPSITLEEEINKIAKEHCMVGLIIGIINKRQEKMVFSYGSKSLENDDMPDENTVFDIGSMTKTFTAILLTETYLNGTFTDDTLAHYLPETVKVPTYDGNPILIFHLATHTSGLPRTPHEDGESYPLPFSFNPENPYQYYKKEHIYDYLTNYCQLKYKPGLYWQYSNTGYGLLGHIVGLANNSNYETALQEKIFNSLGMTRSSLFLTENQRSNYSLGYDPSYKKVPYYVANDIFQGAGFIKSTLNDLFKYLEANLGLIDTPLKDAITLTHEPHFSIGSMGEMALGWYVINLDDGQQIIYSGGDTQGHSSYIGFNKSLSTGVIILSNCAFHGYQITLGHQIMEIINKY